MKTFLLIAFTILSLPLMAQENRSCGAMIEELGISPDPIPDGPIRRVRMAGKTEKGDPCAIEFLPDYCSFEIGAPLKTPVMYYLMSTDDSSISLKFRRGEDFFLEAVTKESTGLKVYKKHFKLKKSEEGYNLDFRIQEGRFFKNELEKFSCRLKRT